MTKYYRKDYSDASHAPFPRRELVFAKRKWAMPASENRLPYSSYNALGWACDATDSGAISIGPHADDCRVSYDILNTATERGEQTWEGSGVYRSISGVDVSSATSIVFSVEFGSYQASTTQTCTCVIGVCNEAGDSFQILRTWTVVGSQRIWFYTPVADITESTAALCFYVSVVPAESDGEWFITGAQLEYDKEFPGVPVATAGAAVVRAVDTQYRSVNKIHRSEHELVQEAYEGIVTPREGQDQSSNVIPVGEV